MPLDPKTERATCCLQTPSYVSLIGYDASVIGAMKDVSEFLREWDAPPKPYLFLSPFFSSQRGRLGRFVGGDVLAAD